MPAEVVTDVLDSQQGGIEIDEGEIRWWTFAGGRINSTLRYALQEVGEEWKIIPDNFLSNEGLWSEVAGTLPNYRLSKFQPLMPSWVEKEVMARYLLDVDGARRWAGKRHSEEVE